MLSRALLHYISSMRTYRLSEPELRRLQASRLRRILASASSTIPHYHRAFRNLGFRAADLTRPSDVGRHPTLS